MKMRINKYLSLCGVASRRGSDSLIKENRVSINGEISSNLGVEVDENDTVCVDGKQVHPPKRTKVLLFHKPPGCVCSVTDPQGRRTVYDYLPPGYHSLKYIGRLDLQSRGLLLFTDDGDLLYKLTHPKFEVPRSYLVWTTEQLTRADATRITNGIDLGEGEEGHAEAIYFEDGFVEMVLTEGKNREIRRMLESVGYEIRDLKRITYAGISLGDLAAGDFRELTQAEEEILRKAVRE